MLISAYFKGSKLISAQGFPEDVGWLKIRHFFPIDEMSADDVYKAPEKLLKETIKINQTAYHKTQLISPSDFPNFTTFKHVILQIRDMGDIEKFLEKAIPDFRDLINL